MDRIDTIFYFAKNEEEYRSANVAPYTIVFVEETREIYLNGYGYGKTSTAGLLSDAEFVAWKNAIQTLINNQITASEQRNAELVTRWLTELQNLHDQLMLALSNLSDMFDGKFDEMEAGFNEAINAEKTRLNGIRDDLLGRINSLNSSIATSILDLMSDYDDIIDGINLTITSLDGQIVQIRRSYVENNDATWADLVLTYNNIKSTVNKISPNYDENGNLKYTAIQSLINQGILDNQAFVNLQARWALTQGAEDILKWMVSGLDVYANEYESFNQMYSAALDAKLGQSAISTIKTEVMQDVNGTYATKAEMNSLVASGYIFTEATQVSVTANKTIESTVELPDASVIFTAKELQDMLGADYTKITTSTPDDHNNLGTYKIKDPATDLYAYMSVAIDKISLADVSTHAYADKAFTSIATKFQGVNNSLASIRQNVSDNGAAIDIITEFEGEGNSRTRTLNKSELNKALVGLLAENASPGQTAKSLIEGMATTGQSTINLVTEVTDSRPGAVNSGLSLGSYIDENGGRNAGFALAAEVFDDTNARLQSFNTEQAANTYKQQLIDEGFEEALIKKVHYPADDNTAEHWDVSVRIVKGVSGIIGRVNETEAALESVTSFDPSNPNASHTYTLNTSKVNEAMVALLAESGQNTAGLTAKSMITQLATSGNSSIDLATRLSDSSNTYSISGLNLGSYIAENGGTAAGFALAADVFAPGTTNIKGMATLEGNVTQAGSRLNTLAEWDPQGNITNLKYKAGLVTYAGDGSSVNTEGTPLATAMASLIAEDTSNNGVRAQVVATVQDNKSTILLDAGKIDVDGVLIVNNWLQATGVKIRNWSLDNFGLVYVDDTHQGDSSRGWYKRKVSLNPDTLSFIRADESTTLNNTSDDILYRLRVSPVSGIVFDKGNRTGDTFDASSWTTSSQFNINGSGQIANNSIKWDTAGLLTIQNDVNVTGGFNVKDANENTIVTINGNTLSNNASGNVTILDANGLYIKRTKDGVTDGFRITTSGGFQRWNPGINGWTDFYGGHFVRSILTSSNVSLSVYDDYVIVLPTFTGVCVELPNPSDCQDGKIIYVKCIPSYKGLINGITLRQYNFVEGSDNYKLYDGGTKKSQFAFGNGGTVMAVKYNDMWYCNTL